MRKLYLLLTVVLLLNACKDIDSINDIAPDQENVISTGADLQKTLQQSYDTWWQSIHGEHPNLALLVAGDAYGLSRGDFGTIEMGMEPREQFPNQLTAAAHLRAITETPWYGLLSSVASANDVLIALDKGVTIDQGGVQDENIRAAAHLVRGLSWGYLGLLFDKSVLVDEQTKLEAGLPFVEYEEMVKAAVEELEIAIELSEQIGFDFFHNYFYEANLDGDQFSQLAHSYAARFLAQVARTPEENQSTNWSAVLAHAEKGLSFDFAPSVDGKVWQSYQQYVFAETGKGPFWARIDQRLVAALDPSQPARYPEVLMKNESPLSEKKAQSRDARLLSDFVFEERVFFEAVKGEWHFSHYRHHRNSNDPSFEGDGWSFGKMPVFLKMDNELLKAEATLRLGELEGANSIVNNSSRTNRGELPYIQRASKEELEEVILYERAIELLGTAPFGLWLDRRRLSDREVSEEVSALGGLQFGTPAQLPVPAKELSARGEDFYTFGGENDPEGIVPVR
ncbi:MAG: RagB/SusD family nutrient uptake outer membrane protein [Bacteroidota bacterium]